LQDLGRPVDVGGYLGADAATELITWADYLVLPSRVESIPVIFSDAAQLRRPLVATPVGDLPRLFAQQEFGVLAQEASAAGISAAIGTALAMPASGFSAQLDVLARHFDIAVVAGEFARRVATQGYR
jgi:glycosyltransferase involved in cell wall biosynthesis